MDPEAEKFRMEHAGLVARSAQGHAAQSMKIKDQEDMWIAIQHHTFRNWVNVQIRDTGIRVDDLSEDMKDGVPLVVLVESLQKRGLRKILKVLNQHQALENVSSALSAISEDGIKLVNIGNVDIVNGNLKLILGLIWSLIMHYQIGQTKFPPKKLMLSWLKAVLPGCDVTNFTTSWNSGILLSALVDHCRPGLFKTWKYLNPNHGVYNCRRAMEIAKREFNIPMVLEPEYLASPYLDELSGMTYLSYFMKEGGPGYRATMDWVQSQFPDRTIKNFTTDWNDGIYLATLVKKLGGPVPGFRDMTSIPDKWESNLHISMEGGKRLGVNTVLSALDMARPDVEYLGPMAYLAYFQWVQPRQWPNESIQLKCDIESIRINNPVTFRIEFLSKEVIVSEIQVEVLGPSGPCRGVDVDLGKRGAMGSFTPKEVGFYEIRVLNEGESVRGSPVKVRALPDLSKITFAGIDPCAMGSIVEVLINSNGAGGNEIRVVATSPTGRPLHCPVQEDDGIYAATFQPDEAGEWAIGIIYDDEHIQGSPFTCHVYDPNAIKVYNLDNAPYSSTGRPYTLVIDATACGWGNATVDVAYNGTSMPSITDEVERGIYEVTFTPHKPARYKVYVYFNGHEVRGSPYSLYLAIEKAPERKNKKKRTKTKDMTRSVTFSGLDPIIKEYSTVVDGEHHKFTKTYDSSLSNSSPNHKSSYIANDINSSATKNYSSSQNRTHNSSVRSTSRSTEDILSSKSYNSALERSALWTDPSQRTLSFELNKKTTFDLTPKNSTSSLNRGSPPRFGKSSPTNLGSYRSSSLTRETNSGLGNAYRSSSLTRELSPGLERHSTTGIGKFRSSSLTRELSPGLGGHSPTGLRKFRSSSLTRELSPGLGRHSPGGIGNYRSSSLTRELSPGYGRSSPGVLNRSFNDYSLMNGHNTSYSTTSSVFNTKKESKTPYRVYFTPDRIRSSKSPESLKSPTSPKTRSPIGSPIGSPFRHRSPSGNTPDLSAPSKVLIADHNVPKSEKFEEFSEKIEETNDEYHSIKKTTSIFKSEERFITSTPIFPITENGSCTCTSPKSSFNQKTSSVPPTKSTYKTWPIVQDGLNSSSGFSNERRERTLEPNSKVKFRADNKFGSEHGRSNEKISSNLVNSESSKGFGLSDEKKSSKGVTKLIPVDITDAVNQRLATSSFEHHSWPSSYRAGSGGILRVDPREVDVTGKGVKLVSIGSRADVFVSSHDDINEDNISVTVNGPGKRAIPVSMRRIQRGELCATYYPHLVGEYVVHVKVCGQKVPGCPFRCYVYDAKEIKVSKIPDGVVGQAVEFEIDGGSAGSGNLEILVNGGHVTSNVRNLGQQRFLASFVPHLAIKHSVEMRFNGDEVPGSPWTVEVMEGGFNPRVSVMGDTIRHFPAGQLSTFDISAPGISKEDMQVHIISPSKRPVSYQLTEGSLGGLTRVSFVTSEVGSYVVEVVVSGQKVQGSPFIAKAYDAGLIRVSDVPNGVVGQPCQFRVDASQAGEGQLEISINDGEVPNHVQVLGGGRCLVSFTPDIAKTHTIDIKFNGETVRGCPFVCRVSDTSRVNLALRHLELIPVGQSAAFSIAVEGGGSAELTVTIRTPSHTTLPVRVSGSVRQGFSAEFTPVEVGAHTIIVSYNDSTVSGTPFTCKVYDASKVGVSHLPRGAIGKSLQFIVDASEAGEGNLEISISAAGRNIPTQVHPQGSARFAVSFVPLEAIDHIINISFNKEPVPGSPFVAKVQADPNRIVVSGQALAATAVGKTSLFTISNVTGSVEDVEVSVEGPSGLPVAAQVRDSKDGTFRVEYTPKSAGEHRIHVSYMGESIPGSPFCCKVYDVNAIKVRPAERAMVGKPVTFLVETNNAGPGNLEVTVNGGQVPTGAQAQGNHVYAISFTPKEAKPHIVELSFNGENVPGSPFTCSVVDVSRVTVSGMGLEKVPVNSVSSFVVDTQATVDQLSVNILSPSRHFVPPTIMGMNEGKIKVEYSPTEVGDHGLEIRVGGVLVPGAPFLVKAYDSTKVKVTDVTSGVVSKPVYFSIDASQAGAGNLEIIVSVSGRNVPNYVQSEGHARFKVNFKPKEAAVHTLSVKFNGEPVPGSPFECRVNDSSHVIISGPGIKMSSLAHPAIFTVDPRGAEVGDCNIQVISPSGGRVPVRLSGDLPKKLTAEFQPLEVGPHTINVFMDGEAVGGSPFTCNIYDVTKVNVSGLENTKVNRPVTFTVDASQAGEGTLELVVTTAKASVRAEVAARSRGLYDVTFTPHEPISHFVNITFNEEEVVGSPFKCEVRELEPREIKNLKRKESQMVTAKGEGLKQVVVGSLASFSVDTKGLEGELDIRVTGPNGGQIPARLFKMRNGIHRAEYRVTQVGSYNVAVLHQGAPIDGTPYLVEAADPMKVILQTTSQCFAGQECGLRVDATGAGRGSLSVGVKAGGQEVKHSIRDMGGGMYQILFFPKIPIPHKVEVRYNGIPVKGAPFEIPVRNPATGQTVTATGLGLHHARVNKAVSFVIETMSCSSKEFDVIITGPHDWAVPVKCYQQKDGNLLAEYTPHTSGNYQIDVLHSGKHVRGSPFTCMAYDASKVVLEKNKANISVGDVCLFKLDKSEAGVADIEAQVIPPSGVSVPLEVKSTTSLDIIEWQPDAPGHYKVEVSYGGEEIPGSPIAVDVGESGLASVAGPGLTFGRIDTPASFTIDGRGLLGEPQVTVDGPESVARVNIRQQEEGLYQITYVPHEVGIFDVRVQWNKKDVSGSPFHPKIIDLRKVRLIGGWESLRDADGKLNLVPREEKRLTFDVNEAGPGRLRCEVTHNGKPIENFIDQSGSRIKVLLTPPSDGQYELKFWYNDVQLLESPITGWVHPSPSGDHTRVTLRGHGLTSARVGVEAEFVIDGSGAGPGSPDVTMSGTRADIAVGLTSEGNGIWYAKYTPRMPGAYLLNVMWSDRQVRGCPLKVNVDGMADASKVFCSGEGLRHGMVGQDIKSFIDTRRAGPGELTARCLGPHKVAVCELYDHRDGTFTLNIRPHESGRHHLSIMYEGEHVPGSPYALKIAGAPDASKVRVYGPGIEHGVLASYQSRFICDTRGAGAGQLTVKIRGPKGAFRVEMQRESQKDRTILCKYDPTEPGDYRVEVKWSGENVPGSPFVIMIFDTQEELNRYMAGGYSPGGPSGGQSDQYGSIGYGYGAANVGQMSWRGSQAQL